MNIVSILFFAPNWFCAVSEHDVGLWKVEKGESDSVQRRKSLSPRRSVPLMHFPGNGAVRKTEVDAIGMGNGSSWRRGQNSSPFLLPPSKMVFNSFHF
jgi:hypothetical protein